MILCSYMCSYPYICSTAKGFSIYTSLNISIRSWLTDEQMVSLLKWLSHPFLVITSTPTQKGFRCKILAMSRKRSRTTFQDLYQIGRRMKKTTYSQTIIEDTIIVMSMWELSVICTQQRKLNNANATINSWWSSCLHSLKSCWSLTLGTPAIYHKKCYEIRA